MGDVVAKWEGLLPNMVSESTAVRDRSIFRVHVPQWLLDKRLKDVTASDLQRVLNSVEGALGTKRRVAIALQSFFTWCVRDRLLMDSPMRGTSLPRGDSSDTEMNPFTWEELDVLVAGMRAHSPALADAVLALGRTGLRWGELRALRVKDVRVTGGMMVIDVRRSRSEGMEEKLPKGGKVRHVPVSARIRPLLVRHLAGKEPDDLVFTTSHGNMLHKSNLRRDGHWKELAPGHRLQDLRHAAATEWLRHGIDAVTVKEWMGHGTLAVTQRYLHYLGTDADRLALEKLDGSE